MKSTLLRGETLQSNLEEDNVICVSILFPQKLWLWRDLGGTWWSIQVGRPLPNYWRTIPIFDRWNWTLPDQNHKEAKIERGVSPFTTLHKTGTWNGRIMNQGKFKIVGWRRKKNRKQKGCLPDWFGPVWGRVPLPNSCFTFRLTEKGLETQIDM